jgi:hypothetical protein
MLSGITIFRFLVLPKRAGWRTKGGNIFHFHHGSSPLKISLKNHSEKYINEKDP